jgi:hypothetical protein
MRLLSCRRWAVVQSVECSRTCCKQSLLHEAVVYATLEAPLIMPEPELARVALAAPGRRSTTLLQAAATKAGLAGGLLVVAGGSDRVENTWN